MNTYRGQCHCGAVGYLYHCEMPLPDWPIRACQCGFCREHGAETTSIPDARIDFTANRADALQRYRFGLQTADFLICRCCGTYLGALIETPDGRFGIVNTRALEPRPTDLQPAVAARYDGEDKAGRIARRQCRWSRVGVVP